MCDDIIMSVKPMPYTVMPHTINCHGESKNVWGSGPKTSIMTIITSFVAWFSNLNLSTCISAHNGHQFPMFVTSIMHVES